MEPVLCIILVLVKALHPKVICRITHRVRITSDVLTILQCHIVDRREANADANATSALIMGHIMDEIVS